MTEKEQLAIKALRDFDDDDVIAAIGLIDRLMAENKALGRATSQTIEENYVLQARIAALEAELAAAANRLNEKSDAIAGLEAEVARLLDENKDLTASYEPAVSAGIVSEYETALLPALDFNPPLSCDEMADELRDGNYAVIDPVDMDSFRYAGAVCPLCGKAQP